MGIVMPVGFLMLLCLVLSEVASGKNRRIIDSVYADILDFTFHAALRRISDNHIICSGAIITDQHILTAAHCVNEPLHSHANLKIITGTSNITAYPGQVHLPQKIYVHPEFTGDVKVFASTHNDIAVIQVENIIEFNVFQSPINLPEQNIAHGDLGILSGWGSTTYPTVTVSNTLQKNWMKIIGFKQCSALISFYLRYDQFCGYQQPSTGACVGDGGAPLVNLDKIVGVISMVRKCATGVPDVYTNVYSHLDFIKRATGLAPF